MEIVINKDVLDTEGNQWLASIKVTTEIRWSSIEEALKAIKEVEKRLREDK